MPQHTWLCGERGLKLPGGTKGHEPLVLQIPSILLYGTPVDCDPDDFESGKMGYVYIDADRHHDSCPVPLHKTEIRYI